MSARKPTYEELETRIAALEAELTNARSRAAGQEGLGDVCRTIVENSNDLPYAVDRDGVITFSGPQVQELGYAPDEVVGRPITDFVHPDDAEAVTREFRRTVETGEEFPTVFRLRGRDGRTRYVEEFGHTLRDGGRVTGLCGALRDVTERREAQEDLRRSREEEHRFRERLAALNEVTVELSAAESFDDLCRRAIELGREKLGFERLGLWFLTDEPGVLRGSFGVDDKGKVRDERGLRVEYDPDAQEGRALAAGTETFVKETRPKAGAEVEADLVSLGVAGLWDGREVIGWLSVDNLLTGGRMSENERQLISLYASALGHLCNRQRATEALRASEQRYDLAERAARIGSWEWDLRSSRGVWSPGLEQMAGLEPGTFGGTAEDIARCVHPEDLKQMRAVFVACARGRRNYEAEYRLVRPDGEVRWVRDVGKRMPGPDGRPARVIGACVDITGRKRAEQALRESEKRHRVLYTTSRDAIMTLAPPAWNFTGGNPASVEMFGTGDEATFVSTSPWDLSPEFQPDGRRSEQKAREMIDTAMREGSHFFEWRHKRLGGADFPATVLLTRVRLGDEVFLQATVRDITERKRAEEAFRRLNEELEDRVRQRTEELEAANRALAESEERYRAIFDAMPDGASLFDPKTGEVIGCNHAFLALHGYTWEQLKEHEREPYWTIHPDDRQRIDDLVDEQKDSPGPRRFPVHRRLKADGSAFWAEAVTTDVRVGGRTLRLGITRDVSSRVEAREALRESERRYRHLFEDCPAVIFSLSADDGTIATLNPAFEMLTGWAREDWLGKPFDGLLHPDDLARARGNFERLVQGGEVAPYEVRFGTRSGDEVIGEVISAARTEGGRVTQVVGFVRDVTENRRAEAALRRNREQLELLISNQHDVIFRLELERGYTFLSPSVKELLGVTPEDFYNDPLFYRTITHPDDLPKVEAMLADVRRGVEPPRMFELRQYHADGHLVHEEYTFSVSRDEAGRMLALEGVCRDVTEQKRAREALRESEERYRNVYETAPLTFVIWDLDCRVTGWNPYAETVFGWSREEALGRSFLDLVVPDHVRPEVNEVVRELLEGELPGRHVNENRTRDGRSIVCEWHNSVLRDAEGRVVGALSLGLDITGRRRAEEALRESEERHRSLFENSAIGMYRTTPDGEILAANPALVRMLGYEDFEELRRRNLEENGYEPGYTRREFREQVERDGRVLGLESAWSRQDGTTLFVRESATAIRDADGRTVYYEGTVEDITERRRAEGERRRSRALLEAAIESIPFDLFALGNDGRYILQNSVCREHWGDVIGNRPEDLDLPADTRERWLSNNRRVAAGETVREETAYTVGGEKRHLYNVIAPIRADGESLGILGINIDITERKEAEQALAESEQRYRSIYEAIPDSVLLYDPATRNVVDANDVMLKTFGYTPDDVARGISVSKLVSAEERDRMRKELAELPETAGPIQRTHRRGRRKDGSLLWVDAITVSVRIHGRDLRLVIVRDVTEAVEAQRRIERQAEILRNVTDAVGVITPERHVTYWSGSAEAMFGYTEADLAKSRGLRLLLRDPEQEEPLDRQIEQAVVRQGMWSHPRLPCRHKDGRDLWVNVRMSAVEPEPSQLPDLLLVARDVTEEVLLEQRLILSERMASIGTLALSVSHELNNMLGGLRGLAELTDASPSLVPRLVTACRAVAERGGAIAGRLTSLSKADAAGEERRIDPAAVVRTVVSMMRPSLAPRNIAVEEAYEAVPETWANEGKVFQVMLNLITNARDSIGEDGRIRVGVRHDAEADRLLISVRDTGAGVRPEDVSRLFEPFFTTKREDGPIGGGPSHLGLGLPESLAIVQEYGGTIDLDSEPGGGATFTVSLPVRTVPSTTIRPRAAGPLPERGTPMLVVDDDELIRFILAEQLADRGYEVACAASGEEALAACRERRFPYVFLDMLMPGEADGPATFRRLREREPDARIIITTAFGKKDIPEDCREAAFAFLKKPFSADDLSRALAGTGDAV
jgi:PAS domain S-box-containing protein